MTILGCPCLNILIHIDKVEGEEEEGLTRVQLTLDGINIQQHFLVHEIKQGDWTIVKCKVRISRFQAGFFLLVLPLLL